jgi:peroxiredoxin
MLLINEAAPGFSLPDLSGQLHTLQDSLGRVVLLNFWSAECPHAARVDGELLADLSRWGSQVTLITIACNANEPPDLINQMAAACSLPLILHDPQGEVADLYDARTTPHLFLIDRDGILRYQGSYDDVTFRQRMPAHFYLRQAVQAVLSGQTPDPAETPPYGCAIVRYNF